MKHLFTSFALLLTISIHAQTTSDFESLTLQPSSVWQASAGSEPGFSDGNIYFPSFWDTSFGGYWWGGFVYSNMTDSVTSGYLNPFSAKAAKGFNASSNYAVNNGSHYFTLTGDATGKQLNGAFITNNTYTFNSMRDGDAFGKKFGGETGNDEDYLRVLFCGFNAGEATDTVIAYLADLRNADNSQDYMLDEWTWVDFTALGNVDSVAFYFESSDQGKGGINTPAYFCIDNVTTADSPQSISALVSNLQVDFSPNPANGTVNVETIENHSTVTISDMNGRKLKSIQPSAGMHAIEVTDLANGVYCIQQISEKGIFASRLVISH